MTDNASMLARLRDKKKPAAQFNDDTAQQAPQSLGRSSLKRPEHGHEWGSSYSCRAKAAAMHAQIHHAGRFTRSSFREMGTSLVCENHARKMRTFFTRRLEPNCVVK